MALKIEIEREKNGERKKITLEGEEKTTYKILRKLSKFMFQEGEVKLGRAPRSSKGREEKKDEEETAEGIFEFVESK